MPVAVNNSDRNGKTIRYLYSDVLEWLNGRRPRREKEVLRPQEN